MKRPSVVLDAHGHLGEWPRSMIIRGDAEGMVASMDAMGVAATAVSAFRALEPDVRAGNDEVAQAMKRYPGRFIGYAVVNPNYPELVLPELERCFGELEMRGLKFHTDVHRYPFDGPNYVPALEFAHERGLPILVHGVGSANALTTISERYENANVIVAHMGCWDGLTDDAVLKVVASRPNVYGDIASSYGYYRSLERLVERAGAEKIIWGSDGPLHEPRAELGRMVLSLCSAEELRLMLGGNFLRLLKLESWPP